MMRITQIVLVGSLAALVASAAPVAAKNTQTPKTESLKSDAQASSDECQAYQQAPDGSWTKLPCQEPGAPQISHKPASGSAEAEAR